MKLSNIIKQPETVAVYGRGFEFLIQPTATGNGYALALRQPVNALTIATATGAETLAEVAGFLRSYLDRATLADMLDSLASGAEDNRRGVYTITTVETSKPYNEEYATTATVTDSLRYVIESVMLRMKPARFDGIRRNRDRSGNLRAVVVYETGAHHIIRFMEEVTS